MPRFHYVVLSKQRCDSSTGQGERASVGRPFAAGRLQDTVSLRNEGCEETTNGPSYLFYLTLAEERLRSQVSTGNTYFARDTYPNPVEYYPLTPHDLTEPRLRKSNREQRSKHRTPSMISFTLPTRPWTRPNVSATPIRASSSVNFFNLWSTSSISLSPSSFLANFSVARRVTKQRILYAIMHLLNRLSLICLVASASTESNSTIIFTIIPVIIGVSWIFV